MNAIIPLVLIAILLVPIVIILTLVSLRDKVKDLTARVDWVTDRLHRLENQLSKFTQAQSYPIEAPADTQGVAEAEAQPLAGLPEEVSATVQASETTEPPAISIPPPVLTPVSDSESTPAWPGPAEVPAFAESAPEPAEPPRLPLPTRPALELNWEQFMGVKLFAWIGGFALFLAMAFLIKYSFDRNLISEQVRVAIGFVVGIGLLIGGVVLKRRELAVTSQTLCATGVVILYAVTFACHSVYHFPFFGLFTTFLLMVVVTAAAFTLAVRLEAMVVAILGLLGGFLTPVLLSTGQDNPAGLFSYIALLDLGLLAVAYQRRWDFLILLGALGTVLMELTWAGEFFVPEKVFVAMTVFLGFDLLFLLAFVAAEKLGHPSDWLSASAIGLPAVTLGFTSYLISLPTLSGRPGVLFSFVLGADLCLLAIAFLRPSFQAAHVLAGSAAFLLLADWTVGWLQAPLLNWALGLYLGFAALHTFVPMALARTQPKTPVLAWVRLFPALALVMMMIPILKVDTIPWIMWPAVLLADLLAIGLALLTASAGSILIALTLTVVVTGAWLLKLPQDLTQLPMLLVVIGGFAVFFFGAGLWASGKIKSTLTGGGGLNPPFAEQLGSVFGNSPEALTAEIPALSAILPFLLLMMAAVRLPLADPSPVFGLALLLVVLLLGLALLVRLDLLVPVSLACVLALEYVWHEQHFNSQAPWTPLTWYAGFYLVYTAFPFIFQRKLADRILPWASSALAGPLHFLIIYRLFSAAFPNPNMGILPAAMAVPMVCALLYLERTASSESSMRLNLLAWFGASALFFITLVFPIQFERQWITLGWALEGLALIWLFLQVPHPGLRATGVVLLTIAFVRLALNPAVLDYHRNSELRVFNWYLYAYGIVTVCLMVGARLLSPPRNLVWKQNIPPFLYTLGTVLAFLLVNIEIADYFAEGPTLTFQFTGSFARDMSYSIAWALFALILLVVGIWKGLTAPRYAALALLCVTLVKLFVHDLSQLAQLYRIGAFLVVAVILILASFLYQRFVSFEPKEAGGAGVTK